MPARCTPPATAAAQLLPKYPRRPQPQPAVDDERDAVHERSGAGTQEQRRVRDVVNRPEAPERTAADRAVARLLVREPPHPLGAVDWTGGDAVHPDAVRSPLAGERPRHRIDAVLRRGRVRLV